MTDTHTAMYARLANLPTRIYISSLRKICSSDLKTALKAQLPLQLIFRSMSGRSQLTITAFSLTNMREKTDISVISKRKSSEKSSLSISRQAEYVMAEES